MLKKTLVVVGALVATTFIAMIDPAEATIWGTGDDAPQQAAPAPTAAQGGTRLSRRARGLAAGRTRNMRYAGGWRPITSQRFTQAAGGRAVQTGGRMRFASRARHPGAFAAVQPTEPMAPTGVVQTGAASYYGGGGRTANGGSVGAATCAHRTLPFGTRILVTNLANAHRAVLTVNDRGPFVAGRIVDVSTGAASVLGMVHSGTAPVRIQVIDGPG